MGKLARERRERVQAGAEQPLAPTYPEHLTTQWPKSGTFPSQPTIFPQGKDALRITALVRAASIEKNPPYHTTPHNGGLAGRVHWMKVLAEVRTCIQDAPINHTEINHFISFIADTQQNGRIDIDKLNPLFCEMFGVSLSERRLKKGVRQQMVLDTVQQAYLLMKCLSAFWATIPDEYLSRALDNSEITAFAQTWLQDSIRAKKVLISVAIGEILGLDYAILDRVRVNYLSFQRATNRNGKRYKQTRKFVYENQGSKKGFDDDSLMMQAEIWIKARIVYCHVTQAVRDYHKKPNINRADSQVNDAYKYLKDFDQALIDS